LASINSKLTLADGNSFLATDIHPKVVFGPNSSFPAVFWVRAFCAGSSSIFDPTGLHHSLGLPLFCQYAIPAARLVPRRPHTKITAGKQQQKKYPQHGGRNDDRFFHGR
jgi:hypothetical protein